LSGGENASGQNAGKPVRNSKKILANYPERKGNKSYPHLWKNMLATILHSPRIPAGK
jgi:hypothetical protein